LFRRQAEACRAADPGSLYGELCERLSADPLVAELAPDSEWNLALRLLAALHYLAPAGQAPELARAYAGEGDAWPAFRATLEREVDWVARFLREQRMQTNEVQRCYGLLPAFLLAARMTGRPLEMIELGSAAGFNLLWDRYAYRYGSERWGREDASVELVAELRSTLPEGLLAVSPLVRKRVGIDLDPVDVTSEHGARLMRACIWPDQNERIERLERAIEAVRSDPPQIVRGDYVELLGPLLEERSADALTVVYQTASFFQLPGEARSRIEAVLDEAGRRAPLAFVSAEDAVPRPARHWDLEFRLWPGEMQVIARLDFHGRWLEWL
jgi:hypothetical protein